MIILRTKEFARKDYANLTQEEANSLNVKRNEIASKLRLKRKQALVDKNSFDVHSKSTLTGDTLDKSLKANKKALDSNYRLAIGEAKKSSEAARIIENSTNTKIGTKNSWSTKGIKPSVDNNSKKTTEKAAEKVKEISKKSFKLGKKGKIIAGTALAAGAIGGGLAIKKSRNKE